MKPLKPPKPGSETAHDILRHRRQPLDVFFQPQNVAVIGATEKEGSVGRTLVRNLITSPFGGTVFPINPKRPNVLGIKSYPTIAAVPEPVDLAVIVTPAPTVPGLIGECADAGVKGAIIISAGFKETGAAGVELEGQVMEQARRGQVRIVGPNCLGIMNPRLGFNATFAHTIARPGKVAFISQSGALCTAILDWSLKEHVGFSAFVSVGSMLDVGWGDLIDYLGSDPHTQSILMYMETIGDARAFLSAAREVALNKPIIAIKVGRSDAAARAAASHTGSMTGSDDVLNAAFRRCGVLRVDTIAELFGMAEVLGKQPRPRGPRVTIVTNAGGPGALATDALILGGGKLAELSGETMSALNQILPPAWSHNNPVDVLGDASAEKYARTLDIVSKDPASDAVLVILTLQAMTDPTGTAEALKPYAAVEGKPIIAAWMGGADVAAGEAILNRANIPTFNYPDAAARAFNYMWRYSDNLKSIYETPLPPTRDQDGVPDRGKADKIIATVKKTGRTILTEHESKQLLAAYGIPTVETHIAKSEEDAVKKADKIGYPVVLKLYSETITHKTDVGGVKLNLAAAAAVKKAFREIEQSVTEKASAKDFQGVTVQPMIKLDGYELILGSSIDPQFGPVLLFGLGGQLVEVFKDRALALPPLNTTLARRVMEQTRIHAALKGVRGRKAVDLAALEGLFVGFSQLVVEQRWIKEIDINPLLVSPERLLALDARVVLHDPKCDESKLPRLAIRPYPTRYASPWKTTKGKAVTIRPIRPEDEPAIVKFHQTLSESSVHYRYFHLINLTQRVAHERLVRVCCNDYDREMALVVEHRDPKSGESVILAVGRLIKVHGTDRAEFAILVSDPYQRHGLGTELLRRLIEIGRAEGVRRITADILPDNQGMLRVCEKLGFTTKHSVEEEVVKASITLSPAK